METTIVTALVDNAIGRLLEDLMLQGGVDLSHLLWRPFDGVGREFRNGLNFTERGYGSRAAAGCSDRAHTAAASLRPGEVDWDRLFGEEGARWFHTGGIFAALSPTTREVAEEAMISARTHGVPVSYDLNFRPSLWRAAGGADAAQAVNRELVRLTDVLLGNEEDFIAALGFEVAGADDQMETLDPSAYGDMARRVMGSFSNLSLVASTLRSARTASINDWGAVAWDGDRLHTARERHGLEILDRIGGGDSFASGLIYALLAGHDVEEAVEWGAAHGALAMTTPGDATMASASEVKRAIGASTARVDR
jgi:2-dehydro-3-deoxygluconokinase